MKVTLQVGAVRKSDARWAQMKAIHTACANAGITPPSEVMDYFVHGADLAAPVVELQMPEGSRSPIRDWETATSLGVEIDLAKVPREATHLVVYPSW